MTQRMRFIATLLAASSMLVALAYWLTRLGAGSLPPHLIDQCDSLANSRNAAPIVVVGILASDTLVLRPVPQHADPKYPLQLRKLQVKVENVLKGDIRCGSIAVYYFTFAGGFDGPQPLGMWRVGSRRILWLRRDSGVLRTACDGVDDCTSGVYSGAHPHFKADPHTPVAYAVADVLLTRGEGKIDDDRFAGAIEWAPPGPEDYLIEKSRNLALTEVSAIKTAACIQLWINAQDRGLPAASRRIAGEALREADCGCVTKPSGELDCGPTTHSDPPW
jgi:hypothetical protein